jgi:hypothetical protein
LTSQPETAPIELRLRDASQLFNTLDPFPFRERDLSLEAEQYIVDRAEDLSEEAPIHIVVHLDSDPSKQSATADVAAAITTWFAGREEAESKAIRALFRDGRRAFLIGIVILSVCLLVAWKFSLSFEGPFARILQESFVIVGWVVIWRPAEIFLYDWLPLVRRRKLYRRLAGSIVSVQSALLKERSHDW